MAINANGAPPKLPSSGFIAQLYMSTSTANAGGTTDAGYIPTTGAATVPNYAAYKEGVVGTATATTAPNVFLTAVQNIVGAPSTASTVGAPAAGFFVPCQGIPDIGFTPGVKSVGIAGVRMNTKVATQGEMQNLDIMVTLTDLSNTVYQLIKADTNPVGTPVLRTFVVVFPDNNYYRSGTALGLAEYIVFNGYFNNRLRGQGVSDELALKTQIIIPGADLGVNAPVVAFTSITT